MKVFALSGKSGTGKSYKAMHLAHDKGIDCIIDDGLFIKGNQILAGKSAKRQSNKMGAVKTALFSEDAHRDEVVEKIGSCNPKGILIIGTSVKMVELIRVRLGLKDFDEIIDIETITTADERELAREQRHDLGKHVIPVPTFQLKSDFSGYFVDPLRIFRKRMDDSLQITEKSVVRPTYSYLGKYLISDKVITDIIEYLIGKEKSVDNIMKMNVQKIENGIIINIDLIFNPCENLMAVAENIQKTIKNEIEYMTALNLVAINVWIKGLKHEIKHNKKFSIR